MICDYILSSFLNFETLQNVTTQHNCILSNVLLSSCTDLMFAICLSVCFKLTFKNTFQYLHYQVYSSMFLLIQQMAPKRSDVLSGAIWSSYSDTSSNEINSVVMVSFQLKIYHTSNSFKAKIKCFTQLESSDSRVRAVFLQCSNIRYGLRLLCCLRP